MRTLSTLLFALRLLVVSAVIYNTTRFLPADWRGRVRFRATRDGAQQIADFFLKQGGIFLKAAQYLSTVSNVFDLEFSEIFAGVPDRAEARPYEVIRYRFLEAFGREPKDLFIEFDEAPLAAASLGQVHVGRIRDGRKVAIKLLHPDMERVIRQDLRAISLSVRLILVVYPHLDFRPHYLEFANMVQLEIDYVNEAESMRRARDQWKDEPRIVVPAVIDELSGSTVLTTEFVEGVSVADLGAIDRMGIDRAAVAELLLESYARMILSHHFYHADPHPGNIFVLPEDSLHPMRLAFVDFGATQDITERMLGFFRRFLEVARSRDVAALVDLAVEAGMLSQEADREVYANLFEQVTARYGSFKVDRFYRINPVKFGRLIKLRDLSTVGLRLRELIGQFRLPRRYIYLGRTITMLVSLAIRLDDRVNVFMVARPHIDRYLGLGRRGWFRFWRGGGWKNTLQEALQVAPRRGEFQSAYDARENRKLRHRIAREATLATMGVVFFVSAAWMETQLLHLWARGFLVGGGLSFVVLALTFFRRAR